MAVCAVCFRHCDLKNGQMGACAARREKDGAVVPVYYGKISSLALDPIEKKPLARFHPGSLILSAGSLGCNLQCPFCQNHSIAQPGPGGKFRSDAEDMSPARLADLADRLRPRGNIGIAFTYNEPLVNCEYVRDTAKLAHEKGLKTVLVTNGTASLTVLEALIPYIDAMNIDLKGFTERYYREVLKGDLQMTKAFIREAVKNCHVELTTLIVPGENDSDGEMDGLSGWIADLKDVYGGKRGADIPLHITRFFPRHRMTDRGPTDIGRILHLTGIARRHLKYVYPGNI
ncbi:MAG: AmmeMemoRadiSam system radical SAM enzyme [Clostridia bacterium]|nr:AmmeMemoRadiSam system radical SAM enzyme [Clostridia bacterium]